MSARAGTVLERIVSETREQLRARMRERPLAELRGESISSQPAHAFFDALLAPGVGVIAEFKRRSPSAGTLREGADVAEIAAAYERGGACAISVLTEGPNFAGSLEDLRTATCATRLPVLRKDFIVDPYQLQEARAAGAAAVLLIVAALEQGELGELHAAARELGLDVLVEVHDRDELRTALAAGAEIVGINNRDLRDFTVDVRRTELLAGEVPEGVVIVSESGIASHRQLEALQRLGVHAVLVGESLMRAPDPAAQLRALGGFRLPRETF